MDIKKLKDIENYSVSDLLILLGFNVDLEELSEKEIEDRINILKQRFNVYEICSE